jgi:hypothetical protein
MGELSSLLGRDRRRRLILALAIYLVTTAVFFACADPDTLRSHTRYNHFALLAQSWLEGRLDLGAPPPTYTGKNDFSLYLGRWYVPFPPFPAVLVLPLVALAGGPEHFQDGQFFLWLAGIAPAVLFLALEKLRRTGRSGRAEGENYILALLFAFGTVYFFSAEQGTVWFAAHVVGAALAALYLLFALDADRPALFAFPLFLLEAARVSLPETAPCALRDPLGALRSLDWKKLIKKLTLFALPVSVVVAVTLVHNYARFDDPFDVGYRHLDVAWKARIEKWGLFGYHYLARNLGVLLTSLPYLGDPRPHVPFMQVNAHGLALWFTSPFYLWLIWPKRSTVPHHALWLTVACVAIPSLLYQNSGWVQFGYRFSNDYAVFLFALLAIGMRPFGALFKAAAVWSIAWNAWGALTFGRSEYARYYFQDPSQRIIYQPD